METGPFLGWKQYGSKRAGFYSSLRGPSSRVANDLRHCVFAAAYAAFSLLLSGTSCPRQRSVGLEGAGGPVGFEPVAEKRGVILASCSSASGLVTDEWVEEGSGPSDPSNALTFFPFE